MSEELPVLFVSVTEAGRILGVGRTKAWELVYANELASVEIGRRRLVEVASIHRWAEHKLASRRQPATKATD